MPFPEASAEVEVLVRGLIAAKAAAVEGVGNVFLKPFYIAGKQQYVEQLGVAEAQGIEVRYLFVQWNGWEDTDKGCDDNPVYNLNYTIRVGQEFIPERSPGSSEEDFTAQCLNLRDAFLVGKDLGWPDRIYCERLVVIEEAGLGDDPHTGMFGHTTAFLLKVEITPVEPPVGP